MPIAIIDVEPYSPRRLPDRSDGDDAMLNRVFDDAGDAMSLGQHHTEKIYRASAFPIPKRRRSRAGARLWQP